MKRYALFILLAALIALCCAVIPNAWAKTDAKLAFVVGNSQYDNVYSLQNATNDSTLIAGSLRDLGFEVVHLENAKQEEMVAALEGFSKRAATADTTLFYFSGHGFQLNGVNYLVPTDAELTSSDQIEDDTLRLDRIISRLGNKNRQTLVFLDACRNNPLPDSVKGRNNQDGLAQMETGNGTFVAFATQPGNITFDGAGENSPFTKALVNHMETPGISISDMMIRVRNTVEHETLDQQTPWDQSSLRSQFYFVPEAEEESKELTDDDRALLLALDPELREKFAKRFNIDLAALERSDEEGSNESVKIEGGLQIVAVDPDDIVEPVDAVAVEGNIVDESVVEDSTSNDSGTIEVAIRQPIAKPIDLAGEEPVKGKLRFYEVVEPKPVRVEEEPTRRVKSAALQVTPTEAQGIKVLGTDTSSGNLGVIKTPNSSSVLTILPSEKTVKTVETQRLASVAAQSAPEGPLVHDDVQGLKTKTLQTEEVAIGSDPSVVEGQTVEINKATRVEDFVVVGRAVTASSLTPTDNNATRIVGQEVGLDGKPLAKKTPNTVVAALNPARDGATKPTGPVTDSDLGKELSTVPVIDLPRSIQTELGRLGCYRGRIDGIWGPGSSRALLRYYATKRENPDDINLNYDLFRKLSEEEKVICTFTKIERKKPSKKAKPRKKRKSSGTVARRTPAKKAVTSSSQRKKASKKKKVTTRKKVAEGTRKIKKKKFGAGSFR